MQSNKKGLRFSVSVISTTPGNFLNSLPALEIGGIDRIHVDVMDGLFVPRLGLYPEFVREIRQISELPIDVHMMLETPEKYLEDFANAGASRLVPHVEPVRHVHRLVTSIKDLGLEAGLALNPHTDFSSLKYVAEELSSVTIMAINPGIVGHQVIPAMFAKIAHLRELLAETPNSISIEVDGGVTFDNVPRFQKVGAAVLVVGAGTIFHPKLSLDDNLASLNSLRSTK
jgi:ribulose-phosphate 3-epimerase